MLLLRARQELLFVNDRREIARWEDMELGAGRGEWRQNCGGMGMECEAGVEETTVSTVYT